MSEKTSKTSFQYWLDEEQNNQRPEFRKLRKLYPANKRRFGAWLRYKDQPKFNDLYELFWLRHPDLWNFNPHYEPPLAKDARVLRRPAPVDDREQQ